MLFVLQNPGAVGQCYPFWRFAFSQVLFVFFVLAAGLLTSWLLHSLAVHRLQVAAAGRGRGEPDG